MAVTLGWRANRPALALWVAATAVVFEAIWAWLSSPSADEASKALFAGGFGLAGAMWLPWTPAGRLARWTCGIGAAASVAAVARMAGAGGVGVRLGPFSAFGMAYLVAALGLAVATRRSGERVEPLFAASPIGGAPVMVVQGGPRVVNHHRAVVAQRHALDLVSVRWAGLRTTRLSPRSLEDFRSYGLAVLRPVAGAVVQVEDGHDDGGSSTPAMGNSVVIATDGERTLLVTLCHLRSGSVTARKGDHVEPGDRLGAVGSSGLSTEPHLHIHATDLRGVGVPVRLGRNRPLWRNRTVEPQPERRTGGPPAERGVDAPTQHPAALGRLGPGARPPR